MLKIVTNPNSILKEKLKDFNFENPEVDPIDLEKQMIETMFAHNGIGLSANQVGINARVFVMGHKNYAENAKAYFNPVVVANTQQLIEDEEGCLSFPGIYVKIKRPSAIKVQYQNSKGEVEETEFHGYECRCFLHEYDHLEGITFKDRTSQLKWALAVKKSQKRKY